mmetsp:Transcript_31510/g.57917  ORF Transcript_31510/g.57917 Transcript_31510/m.57917 type:complete len:234 (-) Transcript_31510:259-960(-)
MLTCSACRRVDQGSATVKVDTALIGSDDKENVHPEILKIPSASEILKTQPEGEVQWEKPERRRKSSELREAQRQELDRIEEERREAEEAEYRQQHRCAFRQRMAEEAAAAEAARRCQEMAKEQEEQKRKAALAQELKRAREELEDADKLNAFLASKGYREDVNSKRKTFRKYYYPLHDAVTAQDSDLVRILLKAGADPALRSSSGKTALERAQKCNRDGSLDNVCFLLEAAYY